MRAFRFSTLAAVTTGFLSIACAGETPEDVASEIGKVCGEEHFNQPLVTRADAARLLTSLGYSESKRLASDDMFALWKEARGSEEYCGEWQLGPVVVRTDVWSNANGGPDIRLSVVEPDEWVVSVAVVATRLRMGDLWGDGPPSEGPWSDPFRVAFVLAELPEQCKSRGEVDEAIDAADGAWLRFRNAVPGPSLGGVLANGGSSVPPDVAASTYESAGLHVSSGLVGDGWTTLVWCEGSWSQRSDILSGRVKLGPPMLTERRPPLPATTKQDTAAQPPEAWKKWIADGGSLEEWLGTGPYSWCSSAGVEVTDAKLEAPRWTASGAEYDMEYTFKGKQGHVVVPVYMSSEGPLEVPPPCPLQ